MFVRTNAVAAQTSGAALVYDGGSQIFNGLRWQKVRLSPAQSLTYGHDTRRSQRFARRLGLAIAFGFSASFWVGLAFLLA